MDPVTHLADLPLSTVEICPSCGSARVYRSRTRGLEKLIKPFTIKRPYACSVCRWRGWALFDDTAGSQLRSELGQERPTWDRELGLRREREATMHSHARAFDVGRTGDNPSRPRPLPPSVASQLGNLARILIDQPAGSLRSVAIVSCSRGDGASTLTVNFGGYLASRHGKVLIVDANPHHPALHAISGVAQQDGLADLLRGDIPFDLAAKPTKISNLFVLTAGSAMQYGTNGVPLASAIRDRVLKCAHGFDFILLDCPAVNAYGDAASTASACDGVILVVEGGRTPRQAAHAAKAVLLRTNCNIVGVVMNKRKFHIPQFIYDRL